MNIFKYIKTNHWQNVARKMIINERYKDYDCKGRTQTLINQMPDDAKIVHGAYNGNPHRWIVYNEKIIEGCIKNYDEKLYKKSDTLN